MFKPKSIDELLRIIPKRKALIKNTQAVPVQDVVYQHYSTNYEGFEITPDIQLLGYEASLLENRQMEKDYPQLAKQVWLFAKSGQGDEWFFARDTELVLFYDHNQGEYPTIPSFLNFPVSFGQFLTIAFLYRDLETRLNETNDNIPPAEKDDFMAQVATISSSFYSRYPYVYF